MAHLDSLPDLKIENLDFEQIPDGFLVFRADEEHFALTESKIDALRANAQLIQDLLKGLSDHGIEITFIIQSYKLLKDNYSTQQGKHLTPTIDGKKHIITMYDKIKSFRDAIFLINEHGPFPSKEVYFLYIIICQYFELYDEYCSGIREVIAPSTSLPAEQTTPVVLPVSTNGKEVVDSEKGNDEEKKDLEKLSSYFKANFKGFGGGHDFFSDLVKDALNLSTKKELGMVACLIYKSNQLNIRRPNKFSLWIRTFFKLLGKTPPKDTHMNKYEPDEIISGIFAYIK